MAEINIPFNDWSKGKLAIQTKKATSRYSKYGKVEDTFLVDEFKYELELILRLPLWFVAENLYRSEGANSKEEFIEVWESIHPRKGFRPFDLVWYHHFKEIEGK